MNKFFTAVTVGVAIFVLNGCAGGGDTIILQMPTTTVAATTAPTLPTITTPKTVPPTTESRANLEDLYLRGVRSGTTELWSLSDADLLDLGYMTCSHFQRGGTNDDLINAIVVAGIDNGVSEGVITDMAGATGVAVAILCPEYAWMLG